MSWWWRNAFAAWSPLADACCMRQVPGGWDEWQRMLRAQADDQAAVLVPRPGYPIYELTAPALAPVQVTEFGSSNGEWTSVTLSYGEPDAEAGPRATVSTVARHGGVVSSSSSDRVPDATSVREFENVMVTIATWGVAMDGVRIRPVRDMRQVIDASVEATIQFIERRRREPRPPSPPPPDLPPAEGVAALRALADFTIASHRELRASIGTGHGPRNAPDQGRLHSALWQRAVRERQRRGGISAEAADADVTSAVNHLGNLVEKAPWFAADERLREAAIDETLRHAMLGETVPSAAAQQAWVAYWAAHLSGMGQATTHEAVLARFQAREALLADWRAAWTAWTALRAP
jgi:hypothetical protein